jgi:hypothetical protein
MIPSHSEVREWHCANCGAVAPGAYCPKCGQNTRERLPTFRQFMREATGRYLSFDGKLWKTLLPLVFRPGFLTRAYFAGRRRRYIGPARLFLVSSLVLFAVLRFASESIDVDSVILTDSSGPATGTKSAPGSASKNAANDGKKAASDDVVVLDDDLNFNVGELPESAGPLKKRIERFNRLPRGQKVEQILAGALRYGPYAMFVLLPAFAALLKMLYLGRRRRHPGRPRLYGEHLVFAAHNHAFLFVVGTLLLAVPVALARQAFAFWAVCYLAWSMRAVYGGSWLGIAARGLALFIVYAVLFTLVTFGLIIVAILLR